MDCERSAQLKSFYSKRSNARMLHENSTLDVTVFLKQITAALERTMALMEQPAKQEMNLILYHQTCRPGTME